jgi:hypothetical protein
MICAGSDTAAASSFGSPANKRDLTAMTCPLFLNSALSNEDDTTGSVRDEPCGTFRRHSRAACLAACTSIFAAGRPTSVSRRKSPTLPAEEPVLRWLDDRGYLQRESGSTADGRKTGKRQTIAKARRHAGREPSGVSSRNAIARAFSARGAKLQQDGPPGKLSRCRGTLPAVIAVLLPEMPSKHLQVLKRHRGRSLRV